MLTSWGQHKLKGEDSTSTSCLRAHICNLPLERLFVLYRVHSRLSNLPTNQPTNAPAVAVVPHWIGWYNHRSSYATNTNQTILWGMYLSGCATRLPLYIGSVHPQMNSHRVLTYYSTASMLVEHPGASYISSGVLCPMGVEFVSSNNHMI